jgi:hypothetical protein
MGGKPISHYILLLSSPTMFLFSSGVTRKNFEDSLITMKVFQWGWTYLMKCGLRSFVAGRIYSSSPASSQAKSAEADLSSATSLKYLTRTPIAGELISSGMVSPSSRWSQSTDIIISRWQRPTQFADRLQPSVDLETHPHYFDRMRRGCRQSLHSYFLCLGRSYGHQNDYDRWQDSGNYSDTGLGRCHLYLSWSMLNEIPQKLEARTSVFWGVSFCFASPWLFFVSIYCFEVREFRFRGPHPS